MLFRLSRFVAACTVLLILAGSLVTSHDAGLSVRGWPTSYGWNMFTFPRSMWVANIFYLAASPGPRGSRAGPRCSSSPSSHPSWSPAGTVPSSRVAKASCSSTRASWAHARGSDETDSEISGLQEVWDPDACHARRGGPIAPHQGSEGSGHSPDGCRNANGTANRRRVDRDEWRHTMIPNDPDGAAPFFVPVGRKRVHS